MKQIELTPIPDYHAPKAAELKGTPEDAQLVYKLDNGQDFVIKSDAETLQDVYNTAKSKAPTVRRIAKVAVSHVEAPKTAPKAEPAHIDLSTLAPREVLRRKIKARMYDISHRTNLYGLFTEKLEDDRSLAMAQKLGIVSSVHCLKHQKAVDKLRGML